MGELHQTFVGHSRSLLAVSFARVGWQLASASEDRTICVWDTMIGDTLQTFDDHVGPVRVVSFSQDGKNLASASDHGTVRIWDLVKSELLAKVLKPSIMRHNQNAILVWHHNSVSA